MDWKGRGVDGEGELLMGRGEGLMGKGMRRSNEGLMGVVWKKRRLMGNVFIIQQRETISKANDIKEEIIRNLNSRCECSLTVDLITDPGFLCSESDQTVVSFRAELHGSPIQQLRDSLEEWLNETTSSISVRAISYDIEDYCSVIVHSEADQPCSYPTGVTTTATAASEGPSYDFAIIVGGAAGVLTVLILAVACGVVICVIVCTKTKHASENLR